MRAKGFSVLGAVLLGFVLIVLPASVAAGQPVGDPAPSPTLGSTESPDPNPRDPDPDDYSGATWIVIGMAVVVVLVAGGTFFVFRNRRRTPADQSHDSDR